MLPQFLIYVYETDTRTCVAFKKTEFLSYGERIRLAQDLCERQGYPLNACYMIAFRINGKARSMADCEYLE